jgi:hypothetical protein
MRAQAESGSNAYRARPFAVLEKEIAALIAVNHNDLVAAERLVKEAAAIELMLDAPSGPADPIKPSFELYGELLLKLSRPVEAAAQFQQALTRMPNRRAALDGLKRATAKTSSTSAQE